MKVFCYQRKIEDWRRKTSRLSLEQRGIYSELIDWYYCTGGDLPSDIDELCRMIGATRRSERQNVQEVINNQKLFSVDGFHLVQKMCDETLNSITQISETNSKSANTRWNKNNNLSDANALPSDSERNANHNLESKNNKQDHDPLNGREILISADALDRARAIADGWDIYYLENAFKKWVNGKKRPTNPDAAFISWIPKFTKGKAP